MNTDKLLKMLLEAIDYSFLQIDGSYDKTLTYPVIDKIQYIKEQVKNMGVNENSMTQELKEKIARNAASGWCRCFKCDGIIRENRGKCDKETLTTCLQ